MVERFYVPGSLSGPEVRLEGVEARHLSRVLRLKAGEQVRLFDGRGTVATAEIIRIGRNDVDLCLLETRRMPPDSQPPIGVATAVPKGERCRWLVEKATELGARRLIPLRTARSVTHPGDGKLEKMRQTVIAACKQSGRNWLMEIGAVTPWEELIEREFPKHTVLLAQPAGESVASKLPSIAGAAPPLLVIGPEGGLTTDELGRAVSAGATPISLGENILRIETAVLALTAVCRLAWKS